MKIMEIKDFLEFLRLFNWKSFWESEKNGNLVIQRRNEAFKSFSAFSSYIKHEKYTEYQFEKFVEKVNYSEYV